MKPSTSASMEDNNVDKSVQRFKSLLFLLLLVLFVFLVAFHNYDRYFLLKDYPVYALTACDPTINSCFVIEPEMIFFPTQTGPYAKVMVNAAIAPACLDEHTCGNFSCEKFVDVGESCEVTFCSDAAIEEGESCVGRIR